MTLNEQFQQHVNTWKKHTKFESSYTKLYTHPAYQAIINMGKPVIPLILDELRKEPGHWFVALHEITGDTPIIDKQYAGSTKELTKLWLDWAEQHNY